MLGVIYIKMTVFLYVRDEGEAVITDVGDDR